MGPASAPAARPSFGLSRTRFAAMWERIGTRQDDSDMDQASAAANDLRFDLQDGIGRITFNRPQARNAFTFAMYERLAQICEQADRDPAIKVLVLQGAGDKAFASGTDINQFRAFETPQDALDYEPRIDRVLTTLEQCRVPTIDARFVVER